MLYTLKIAVLLASFTVVHGHKVEHLHKTTFSIPYPTLYTCQQAQELIDGNKEAVGWMAARQWIPRKLAPIAAETDCVADDILRPTIY
jgi:hypothetical protein